MKPSRMLVAGIVAAALCVSAFGSPFTAARLTLDDELNAIVAAELRDTRTPGAALAVIKDGRVILAKGFGEADVETHRPLEPGMLFRLGSTTKMFTAATVVTLADEGKLTLDAPVARYVPGLPPNFARISAHQLLSHTAGIKDTAPMFGRHDEEALGAGIKSWDASYFFAEPGRVFSYSNPGYWAAGFLAEHVAGMPYADVVADRLLKPLGMTRSTFRPMMAMTWPLAIGHDSIGGAAPAVIRPAANNAATWPAGSLFSNVHDLSRFVIAFMDGGRIDGKQALRESVVQRLSAGAVDEPNPARRYAYGLTITKWRGTDAIEHGGSRAGFGSTIRMLPRERAAVIVLANRTGSGMPKTAAAALAHVVPSLGPETQDPRPAPTPVAASEFAQYGGTYSQGSGSEIVVSADGDRLTLKDGAAAYTLLKIGAHRFTGARAGATTASAGNPPTFVFVPGADGRAEFVYRGSRALKRQDATGSDATQPAREVVPPPKPVLENEYVRATKNAAPCAAASARCGDRVFVALGELVLPQGLPRAQSRGRRMQRGDLVVFKAGESYVPPSGGSFVEVAIKPSHPPVQSPKETIAPEKNAIVYDGDRFFIFEEKLAPGETRARHSHSQRVVIVLNDTRLQQWPDGEPELFKDQIPDEVKFNPPVIHVVKTVGAKPLRNIVIEFKKPK